MSELEVVFRLKSGEQLVLRGCAQAERSGGPRWITSHGTRVRKHEAGELTLSFLAGSEGLKEIERRLSNTEDEGASLDGMMTVTDDGSVAEYECSFLRSGDRDFVFVFTEKG